MVASIVRYAVAVVIQAVAPLDVVGVDLGVGVVAVAAFADKTLEELAAPGGPTPAPVAVAVAVYVQVRAADKRRAIARIFGVGGAGKEEGEKDCDHSGPLRNRGVVIYAT